MAVTDEGTGIDGEAVSEEGTPGSVDSVRAPCEPSCPSPGRYRHYKGADYRVLGCVRHSESEEWLVLYRALYGEHGLWVRPLAMFVGEVETDGRSEPRFARQSDPTDAGT